MGCLTLWLPVSLYPSDYELKKTLLPFQCLCPVALTCFSLSAINTVTGSKLGKGRVCFLSQLSGHTPPLRALETGTEAGTPEERCSLTGSQVHTATFLSLHFKKRLVYFTCSSVLSACSCLCTIGKPDAAEGRRGHQIPWEWSYRWS